MKSYPLAFNQCMSKEVLVIEDKLISSTHEWKEEFKRNCNFIEENQSKFPSYTVCKIMDRNLYLLAAISRLEPFLFWCDKRNYLCDLIVLMCVWTFPVIKNVIRCDFYVFFLPLKQQPRHHPLPCQKVNVHWWNKLKAQHCLPFNGFSWIPFSDPLCASLHVSLSKLINFLGGIHDCYLFSVEASHSKNKLITRGNLARRKFCGCFSINL